MVSCPKNINFYLHQIFEKLPYFDLVLEYTQYKHDTHLLDYFFQKIPFHDEFYSFDRITSIKIYGGVYSCLFLQKMKHSRLTKFVLEIEYLLKNLNIKCLLHLHYSKSEWDQLLEKNWHIISDFVKKTPYLKKLYIVLKENQLSYYHLPLQFDRKMSQEFPHLLIKWVKPKNK